MPKVSVIIPTFGHRDYVLQAIESVFAQTFADYEVIVINDGSPDDTAERLRPLADSGRIRYLEQANSGQGAARNRGIQVARGEYVAFLDDDDTWPAEKLAWQVALLEGHPQVLVVYGFAEILRGDARSRQPPATGPSGSIIPQFAVGSYIRSPGQTLIRREALVKVGGFDASLWGVDDWDLWLRLSAHGEFLFQDRPALTYLEHEQNASLKFYKMLRNARKVRDKHFRKAEYRHLFQPCDRFIRKFVISDGVRFVDQSLAGRRYADTLRGIILLLWISRGRFGIRYHLFKWGRQFCGAAFKRNQTRPSVP